MKKMTYWLACLVMMPVFVAAQSSPLYKCDTLPPPNNSKNTNGVLLAARDFRGAQMIHYETDFPGMPSQGTITDIYIQIRGMTPAGAKLPGLLIKLGASAKMSYPQNNIVGTVQHPYLDTFYYNSMYVLQDTLWPGDWLKLPLQTPYNYSFVSGGDSARNLIVEIVHDSLPLRHIQAEAYSPNFLTYSTTNLSVSQTMRCVYLLHNGTVDGTSPGLFVIGFNPKQDPLSAAPLWVSNHAAVLYPNPAKDRININCTGSYSIANMQGQVLLQGEINNNEAISIVKLTPGTYTVFIKDNNGNRHRVKLVKN